MPLAEGWIRLFLQFCLENPLFCNKLRPIALIKNCKEAVRLFFPPNWFPLLFFKRLAFLFASFLDLDRYLPGGVFPLNFCTRLFTNRLPFALCFFPHAENYFSIHAGFFPFLPPQNFLCIASLRFLSTVCCCLFTFDNSGYLNKK